MSSKLKIIIYIYILSFIFPASAYAYIDPGAGSMILQALAAGVLAIGVFWRRIVGWIKGIFQRSKKQD